MQQQDTANIEKAHNFHSQLKLLLQTIKISTIVVWFMFMFMFGNNSFPNESKWTISSTNFPLMFSLSLHVFLFYCTVYVG